MTLCCCQGLLGSRKLSKRGKKQDLLDLGQLKAKGKHHVRRDYNGLHLHAGPCPASQWKDVKGAKLCSQSPRWGFLQENSVLGSGKVQSPALGWQTGSCCSLRWSGSQSDPPMGEFNMGTCYDDSFQGRPRLAFIGCDTLLPSSGRCTNNILPARPGNTLSPRKHR